MDMLNEGNAKHAKEFANCTKDETLALHKKGAAAAAAAVRGLSDAELDRSATVLTGMPAMTVQQMIEGILIHHVDDHSRQHPQDDRPLTRRSRGTGASRSEPRARRHVARGGRSACSSYARLRGEG